MLTDNQKKVLQRIAERRQREGRGCYFETRAQFYQLMGSALSVDPTLSREEFFREARHELAKHLQK